MKTPMTEHLAHIELLEEFGSYTEKRIGYFELNHRNLIDAGIEKGRQMERERIEELLQKEYHMVSKNHTDSVVNDVIRGLLQALKGEK